MRNFNIYSLVLLIVLSCGERSDEHNWQEFDSQELGISLKIPINHKITPFELSLFINPPNNNDSEISVWRYQSGNEMDFRNNFPNGYELKDSTKTANYFKYDSEGIDENGLERTSSVAIFGTKHYDFVFYNSNYSDELFSEILEFVVINENLLDEIHEDSQILTEKEFGEIELNFINHDNFLIEGVEKQFYVNFKNSKLNDKEISENLKISGMGCQIRTLDAASSLYSIETNSNVDAVRVMLYILQDNRVLQLQQFNVPVKKKQKSLRPLSSKEQKELPISGTFRYDVAFAEWNGKSMGEKVTLQVENDYVKVTYEGDGMLTSTKPGKILEEGYLRKHKSGEWIIVNTQEELNLDEIGGCTGGPSVIDFSKKKFWMC